MSDEQPQNTGRTDDQPTRDSAPDTDKTGAGKDAAPFDFDASDDAVVERYLQASLPANFSIPPLEGADPRSTIGLPADFPTLEFGGRGEGDEGGRGSMSAPLRTVSLPPDLGDASADASLTEDHFGTLPPPPSPQRESGTRGGESDRDPGAPLAPFAPDLPDYELRQMLGRGGQGEVWRALQRSLHREVAVKRLHAGSHDEFLQEAYTAAELEHPNIVPVHDLGKIVDPDNNNESALIAMKLVSGAPWDEVLKKERESLDDAGNDAFLTRNLNILVDVCNAVAFAHSRGILHRDLKPSQVMIGGYGEVFLMDWGLAISVDADTPLVDAGRLPKYRTLETATNQCGSPAYMAPEQTSIDATRLGRHTDIYLLGAILYELLMGRPPHAARSARAAYMRAAANDFEPVNRGPEELRSLATAALSYKPEDRPASVEEFRGAIDDYVSGATRCRESEAIATEVDHDIDRYRSRADAAPIASSASTSAGPAFVRTASGTMKPGAGQPTYEDWMDWGERLNRALRLWPGNPNAERLRGEVIEGHAGAAIAAGDLTLARTLISPLSSERQEPLKERIEAERKRRAAHKRQRRILQGVSTALLLIVLTLVGYGRVQEEALERERVERRLEQTRREIAQQLLLDEEKRADLFRRANELRTAENELAMTLRGLYPDPSELPSTEEGSRGARESSGWDFERWEEAISRLPSVMEERDALVHEREALEAEQLYLGAPPHELALGEANAQYLAARTVADFNQAAEGYERVIAYHPEVSRAQIGLALAHVGAGRPDLAPEPLRKALELIAAQRGEADPEYADTLRLLGATYTEMEIEARRGETYGQYYADAAAILEPQWIEATRRLAAIQGGYDRLEDSVALTSAALQLLRSHYYRGSDAFGPRLALTLSNHGHTLGQQGKMDEAIAALLEAERVAKDIGYDTFIPQIHDSLSDFYLHRGDLDRALEYVDLALAGIQDLPPDAARLKAEIMGSVANTLVLATQYQRAEPLLRTALELTESTYGPDSVLTAQRTSQLARYYNARFEPAKAEELFRKSLAVYERSFGADSRKSLYVRAEVADTLSKQGRADEAIEELKTISRMWVEKFGPQSYYLNSLYNNLAAALDDAGRLEEGLAYYAMGYGTLTSQYGPDHYNAVTLLFNTAVNLVFAGYPEEALLIYRYSNLRARELLGSANFISLITADDAIKRFGSGDLGELPISRSYAYSLNAWIERALNDRPESDINMELELRIVKEIRLTRWLRVDEELRGRYLVPQIKRLMAAVKAKLTNDEAADHLRGRYIEEYNDLFDVAAYWDAHPERPEHWWRDGTTTISTAELVEWLDSVAPAVDLAKDHPELIRDPAHFAPAGEELRSAVMETLIRAVKRVEPDMEPPFSEENLPIPVLRPDQLLVPTIPEEPFEPAWIGYPEREEEAAEQANANASEDAESPTGDSDASEDGGDDVDAAAESSDAGAAIEPDATDAGADVSADE